MIDKTSDIIYNLDYVVCLPAYDQSLLESFIFTFQHVMMIENNENDIQSTIQFFKKNNIKKVIFVDYYLEYQVILNGIGQIDVAFIFTRSLASLSDYMFKLAFEGIFNICETRKVGKIGVLNHGLYEVLKNQKFPVYEIALDVAKLECSDTFDKTVGLLNNQNDTLHSFYNELSALKLNGNFSAKLLEPNQITEKFVKTFEIPVEEVFDLENLILENSLNLMVNFTNNDISLFLKSMDAGIPCIVGNNDFLVQYPVLQKSLMVESDDDINEIAQKMDFVLENKDEIMKEYKKFRYEYQNISRQSVIDFLGYEPECSSLVSSDLLLSVVVPVYNVEDYIEECLNSIIKARIPSMEILVINDGSTDSSEEKISPFVEQYPDLIRYIKQENHGLGNVRNVGMHHAKGKYIASIDSDDTVHSNFFKEALPYLESDIDVVFCDWLSIPENGDSFETAAIDLNLKNLNRYQNFLYTTIMPSTCNKIFKKQLYSDIDLKFVEGLKFEDLGTNPVILLRAQTFKYINKPYYEYKIRGNSIMRSGVGYHMMDIIQLLNDRIHKNISKFSVDLDEFYFYTYYWRVEESVINLLYDLTSKEIDDFVEYMEKSIGGILDSLFDNPFVIKFFKTLSKDEQRFYKMRNEAWKKRKFASFIKKCLKDDSFYKLTAVKILYSMDDSRLFK